MTWPLHPTPNASAAGHSQRATALYEESLALWRQLRCTPGIASALHKLGQVSRSMADLATPRVPSISEKTVGSHVDHIMTKLDLRSRTRIAVWAVQHGLSPSHPD